MDGQGVGGAEGLARRLYESHGPALTTWMTGRFADTQLAEEAVQETVLAAWRKYDQFDPERGSERAWIFGIARNAAANRYRRNLRHLQSVPTDELADSATDDAEIARLVERSLIADALRSLSEDHRAVVAAAYWDGLSTKEIAARFDIPDGTVKSRLHYALKLLRAQLQERQILR